MLAAPGALYRAYFALADVLRRAQSEILGAFGLGPQECRYRITESGFVLASPRLCGSTRGTSLTYRRSANQTTLYLGPSSLGERNSLLLTGGLPRLPPRMAPRTQAATRTSGSTNTQKPSQSAARGSRATKAAQSHSSSVTRSAARWRQSQALSYPNASRVSSSSERRFVLNRPRANSGTVSSPWFRRCCPTLVVFRARSYHTLRPWQLPARSYGRD